MERVRTCKACGETKHIHAFNPKPNWINPRICEACQKDKTRVKKAWSNLSHLTPEEKHQRKLQQMREYRAKNREYFIKYLKDYRTKNKTK